MASDVEYGEKVECHTMVFSDIDVEVAVDGEGNAWVNLNRDGEVVTSFSYENWTDIAAFVQRHAIGDSAT